MYEEIVQEVSVRKQKGIPAKIQLLGEGMEEAREQICMCKIKYMSQDKKNLGRCKSDPGTISVVALPWRHA